MYISNLCEGGINMPKDSQIDNKVARQLKSNFQTTITDEEPKNSNRNMKKNSVKREGFSSKHNPWN